MFIHSEFEFKQFFHSGAQWVLQVLCLMQLMVFGVDFENAMLIHFGT
jgi:hypothetical protein